MNAKQKKAFPVQGGPLVADHKPGDSDITVHTGAQKMQGGTFYFVRVDAADDALLDMLSIAQTTDAMASAAEALVDGKPELALQLCGEAFARLARFQYGA